MTDPHGSFSISSLVDGGIIREGQRIGSVVSYNVTPGIHQRMTMGGTSQMLYSGISKLEIELELMGKLDFLTEPRVDPMITSAAGNVLHQSSPSLKTPRFFATYNFIDINGLDVSILEATKGGIISTLDLLPHLRASNITLDETFALIEFLNTILVDVEDCDELDLTEELNGL